MATTIAISCPKCEKQIKAPVDLVGKKIRCKECQNVFVVKAPPGGKAKGGKGDDKKAKEAVTAAAPADEDEESANPYDVTDHDFLPRCPYCAKELDSEEQVICLNCGYNRRTRERIKVEKTLEPTFGEWTIHLLPGILCALLVLSNLGSLVLLWINRQANYEEYAKENGDPALNPYGLGLALWSSVFSLFIVFLAGRFAVKRLILHTRPPERSMKSKK